jgi:hypothetical protein
MEEQDERTDGRSSEEETQEPGARDAAEEMAAPEPQRPLAGGEESGAGISSEEGQPAEESGAEPAKEETAEDEPAPAAPRREVQTEKYRKFKKVDGATYRRVNQFLRKRTYITAREWAIARLCADFSTRSGAEMTYIGEHLPELVPFMTDTYTPQAVNQARSSFKRKVRKSGATFFYGALCGFFTADELDDILFESSEVARFLLEVEGTSIGIDDEIEVEDKIADVMRSVAEAASMIRQQHAGDDDGENQP